MNTNASRPRADRRQPELPHVPPHRRYVPVTISLKPAIKARLDAIAKERSKGAWIGAVKYSDVIREGIDLVLAREDAKKPAPKKRGAKR